jgi:lipoate-protein ligase B
LITFHGPGQLVAYPILNLRSIFVDGSSLGAKRYVSLLEGVLIRVATNTYGLRNVGRTKDPGLIQCVDVLIFFGLGVWIEENRKIAAIGIQIRNGITSHGIALNCNTDLNWYNHVSFFDHSFNYNFLDCCLRFGRQNGNIAFKRIGP